MTKTLPARLGFWSSVIVTVLGVVYLVILVVFFSTLGFETPPTPFVQTFSALGTIIMAPAILVIFAVIAHLSSKEQRVLGTVGLSFTILFVAMTIINRFVQLTIIRHSSPAEQASDLARFLPYGTGSVMLALEFLGWSFFLPIACLFVAPLFSGPRLNRVIRWLFILYAIFGLMGLAGFATTTPLQNLGFIAWGPVLLALTVCLSILFRRDEAPILG